MEISKYHVFMEVVRSHSFSGAAQTLGYTQSGISHTLKRLEQELGLTLFYRDRNGAYLTPAGEEVLPYIQQIVQCQNNLQQGVENIHELNQGTLHIGTYSSISRKWLPGIIRKFQQDYPSIEIHFKEGGAEDILGWIERREVDMGFFSENVDDWYDWIPLMEDPLLAVLPPDFAPEYAAEFPLESCNGQNFIISEKGTDIDIHRLLYENDIQPEIRYSAKDDYTIVAMVACGLGISILPGMVLEHNDTNVRTLPLAPRAVRRLGLAVPSVEMASPAARKFIEYTRECIREFSVTN
jgi:DNA-binding transcriptional LysR family regulator